jgi:large repetitive protein
VRLFWTLSDLGGFLVTDSSIGVRRVLAVALAAILISLGLHVPATAALPGAPTGLIPSGATVSGNPILQWNRVSGATSYKVDISNDDSFATGVVSYTTVNRRLVPTTQLKSTVLGEIFWRVRAVNSTGTGAPATSSFFRNPLAGPTLISPTQGQSLAQPGNPPVLAWTPVAGAISYTVQVDTDDSFIAPFTVDNKITSTTSYLVPTPLIAQPYHWRVKATLGTGVETEWSETRIFEPSGLTAPVLVSPEDNADTKLVDVVLDWAPVPGASKYALQISTDQNFLSGVTTVADIVGTRYSPPVTLGNDQYWWRVRPYDAAGNFLDWAVVSIWTFQRHWPDQPVLNYPIDEQIVSDPVYFQWQAVPHASSYTLEMHTAADFEPAEDIIRCTTVNTTFVPRVKDNCWPGAANSYYWRVVANDAPRNPAVVTDKIVSQVEHFHYLPPVVNMATATPANGSSVAVPTLRWNPVPNAAKYRVFLIALDGGAGAFDPAGVPVSGTSYTPRTKLTVGKSYRWWVQTISSTSRNGSIFPPEAQNTFTVIAQPDPVALTPEPTAPASAAAVVRFPTLQWTPVVNATFYKIGIRPANSVQAFTELATHFPYPAGEDTTTTYLQTGTYEWEVYAFNASNVKFATSAQGRTFVMGNLAAVTGQRAALTGNSSGVPGSYCSVALPNYCVDMRATPVLRWNAVPSAGFYKVTLSRDAEMTSIISTTVVDQNMFAPTTAFADSQAGKAYHWFVQPCKADEKCSPLAHALHAFNKKSNGVQLLSPADSLETKIADTVTFTWRDWLQTNTSPAGLDPGTGISPQAEAKNYRIDVATDEAFTHVIDTATVDQTTYTAYAKAYPEGPIYWRVMAIDGSDNLLTASPTWKLDKESPQPSLLSPIGNDVIDTTEPFRWTPLNYAVSYDIEINKDDNPALANRLLSANSKLVAFTATSPLPASPKAYLWRARPVNASGFKGEWSTWGRFFVKLTTPVLISPVIGTRVRATDGLFSWESIQGAASYKFERRVSTSASISEAQKTVALAWAPTARIPDGNHQWRVTAYDAKSQAIGTSGWRSFVVDELRPTVIAKSPNTYAGVTANFKAQFSEPVKGVNSTTVKLYVSGRTSPLSATVTLSADKRWATLNPTSNLVRGKYYTVKLISGITDLLGNTLVATSWKVRAR